MGLSRVTYRYILDCRSQEDTDFIAGVARRLEKEIPNAVILDQYVNDMVSSHRLDSFSAYIV